MESPSSQDSQYSDEVEAQTSDKVEEENVMPVDAVEAAVAVVVRQHQAELDRQWNHILERGAKRQRLINGLSAPGIAEQNQHLLTSLKDTTSYERYAQLCIKYEIQGREYRTKIEQLEIDVARLRATQKCSDEEDRYLRDRIAFYQRFIDSHNLSDAFEFTRTLYHARQSTQQDLRQHEEFLQSQNLCEAFKAAYPQ